MAEPTDRRAVVRAAAVAFALFVAWWAGVNYLDGALAAALPYHRYETVALLYPDVHYHVLPGWIVAGFWPFVAGVYLTLLAWLAALSLAVGVLAARIGGRRGREASLVAAGIVLALFVAVTAIEAVVSLAA